MKNKILLARWAIVIGFLFLILAMVYWFIPAGSLPTFLPGYKAGVTTVHFKHGVASFILGFALFAYAWFQGGKETSTK